MQFGLSADFFCYKLKVKKGEYSLVSYYEEHREVHITTNRQRSAGLQSECLPNGIL